MLIPKEITSQIWQATPKGNQINCHLSLVVFSTANGQYKNDAAGIQGAPLPVLIHSSRKKNDKEILSPAKRRISLYNHDPDDDNHVDERYLTGLESFKNLDLKVFTTPKGSMEKETFVQMVPWMTARLPSHLGANGQYSFLLLDGHISRWHPKALFLLMKKRMIPIFFPSHTTIVAQPNDNGTIYKLHTCIEEAAQSERTFERDT